MTSFYRKNLESREALGGIGSVFNGSLVDVSAKGDKSVSSFLSVKQHGAWSLALTTWKGSSQVRSTMVRLTV